MKNLIYFEWLHFSRGLARPIAVLLFLFAASFGIYNGFNSYHERLDQVDAIKESRAESHQEVFDWFESGVEGPEERPWVKISTPFWSMWYAKHQLVQTPSPLMVYNIGQSEHFGYYKRVSMWSTAFDDDLAAEIANPEFVHLGALDFSFVWIYLMPLLLIVLAYQVKGLEQDVGILPLLRIQQPSTGLWLLRRLMIMGVAMLLLLSLLVWIPELLFLKSSQTESVLILWMIYTSYLLFWLILVFLVIYFGKGQADQALKMVGLWLLFAVAIPGVVNQYVLLRKPADLMLSLIEANRDGQQEIWDRPQDKVVEEALAVLPELQGSEAATNDSLLERPMINAAYRLVWSDYIAGVSNKIMEDQEGRNDLISATYWFNPVGGFHKWLNGISCTGHEASLGFRRKIQEATFSINQTLIMDEWKKRKMDKASFNEYAQMFEIDGIMQQE